MEGNRGEAEECIRRAETYLEHGDFKKAKKLLEKAKRLYPSQRIEDLLKRVEQNEQQHQKKEKRKCTPEQQQEVKRINLCWNNDYYRILGVERGAGQKIMKRKYQELARKVHPDKCDCEGAEEAFKLVDGAYKKLMAGEHSPQLESTKSNDRSYGEATSRHYANNFKADTSKTYETAGGRWQWQKAPPQEETLYNKVKRYVSLAVIVLGSLLWLATPHQPLYSLERSSEYSVRKLTQDLEVPYFVKDNFYKSKKALLDFEESINDEYLKKLENSCDEEKTKRDLKMWKARNLSDRQLFKEAHYMTLWNCEKLHFLNLKR